jgi:maleamate amidohydrolase
MRDFEDHCWRDAVDEDTLALYRENYARETFVGPKPALIAVDLARQSIASGQR